MTESINGVRTSVSVSVNVLAKAIAALLYRCTGLCNIFAFQNSSELW